MGAVCCAVRTRVAPQTSSNGGQLHKWPRSSRLCACSGHRRFFRVRTCVYVCMYLCPSLVIAFLLCGAIADVAPLPVRCSSRATASFPGQLLPTLPERSGSQVTHARPALVGALRPRVCSVHSLLPRPCVWAGSAGGECPRARVAAPRGRWRRERRAALLVHNGGPPSVGGQSAPRSPWWCLSLDLGMCTRSPGVCAERRHSGRVAAAHARRAGAAYARARRTRACTVVR